MIILTIADTILIVPPIGVTGLTCGIKEIQHYIIVVLWKKQKVQVVDWTVVSHQKWVCESIEQKCFGTKQFDW